MAKAAARAVPLRLAVAGQSPGRGPETAVAGPISRVMAAIFPETMVLVTRATAMAFPETADEAMVVPATADQATADQAMADQATATVDPATETVDPATETATVDPATVDPATATVDPATATVDLATATVDLATETETVDLSVEQAFFERAMASSDRPVSFDTELSEPSLDLEARELRRAHFTRVVGAIVAALGVGALLALVQAGPGAAEAAPFIAAYAVPQEMPEMQLIEPGPTMPPAPRVSVAPAPRVSVAPARSVSAATSVAPSPRKRAPKAAVATPPTLTDVNQAPPTARFVD